jgi:hypothetical protein
MKAVMMLLIVGALAVGQEAPATMIKLSGDHGDHGDRLE